jgi:endonuclease G
MAQTPQESTTASVMRDRRVVDEILAMAHSRSGIPGAAALGVAPETIARALEGPAALEGMFGARAPQAPQAPGVADLEAIILLNGRPSLLVRNKTFELPSSLVWKERLLPHRTGIERSIVSVGRVELLGHDDFDWVGTAWVVGDDTVVTNRHVAAVFAARRGERFVIVDNLAGDPVSARVDFREEHQVGAMHEVAVEEVIFIAEPGLDSADVAFLRLESGANLPRPVRLAERDPELDQVVAVVGYPARDSRNGADAMADIFGDIYDVKRLAPGRVMADFGDVFFTHDCSTLGGNSGSLVMDVESGEAVGLHFAGRFRTRNYAVKASTVRALMGQLDVRVSVPAPVIEVAPEASGTRPPEFFAGRSGYASDFLGAGQAVSLPGLGRWDGEVAAVSGASAESPHVAHYEHFSVVVSQARKLPLITAVNIDGTQARRIPRQGDRWFLDGRIATDFQLGNEVYRGNDLDRGHMVRRLDPVWGDHDTAARANEDTFFYVNAVPQHRDLNRTTWVALEDYILDNADALDLKVSVFTGPVFRESDADYRGLVRLPREFWKVAALVNADTGELSATGYLLSQADLISDLEAFVFGKFRTYQVPIAHIELLSGLSFGELRDHDPLADAEEGRLEIAGAPPGRVIDGPRDILFHRSR